MRFSNTLGALALASSTVAQGLTTCDGDVCFVISIPTATAASGTGDIFIQMSAPTTVGWIGIGQGPTMFDSNLFMMYSNAAGTNVTLSPRLGVGEVDPDPAGTTAEVTLLSGSGISDGIMTGNFKCSNCASWPGGSMNFNDPASKWIYAWDTSAPVASDSLTIRCAEHSNYGEPTWDLTMAAGGDGQNPFTTSAAAVLASGATPAGSIEAEESKPSHFNAVLRAHAIIGAIAFAIMYPLGAIAIRILSIKGLLWIHAGWMIFTYALAISCMGMGIWLAVTDGYMSENHSRIGIVVVCGLVIQPFTGFIHHKLYKSSGSPNTATYPHVWFGRALIFLGVINGGLGLKLAGADKGEKIAYGAIAGVMYVAWIAVIAWAFIRSRDRKEGETGEGVFPTRDQSEEMQGISHLKDANQSTSS
ncbi:uncharacterized protein L3040_004498 [Drepanopeziza brunnea f. sp. 'multigermtubi']|uniref:Integral membrane protein n=1 Tax=Marssonina brunnea f. sp. multigermtubi (strain MB_m1) TaxID=1072389 RepID=K1XB55_MARBU|nr:uncharacterized protein MBM_03730 [Drepanopeziza brunnea f. sp. 'multigermtubi' MB_m1]EKD17958.1 integral membrane protein [Drepanopeziza brunnea f. sp. 'multigermtubi' MB_m1]KAJ5043113.1 hypothetical protein L3040_004498 [Drepanopeziza brunnea f. sp. 'multigermtubi']